MPLGASKAVVNKETESREENAPYTINEKQLL